MTFTLLVPARIKDLRLFEDGDCLRYLISGTPPYNITWQHNGDLIQNGKFIYLICEPQTSASNSPFPLIGSCSMASFTNTNIFKFHKETTNYITQEN